ncbi:MAG: ATP-binding protein [Cytophagales bacterium]|nr:ATP-binding protein [Cytophagales bacterium]
MDFKELSKLVLNGEGDHLEFKLKSNHPEKIIREMVAFANTSGGKLLIGVNDNGELIGLSYADEDEYVLEKALKNGIEPALNYKLEKVRLPEGKEVLVFNIPKGTERPYYILGDNGTKKVYVRVADKSIQASKEAREILKGYTKNKSLRFTYGDKETHLMKYLSENLKVTVSEFAKLVNIPKKNASRTLILLVLTNVLGINYKEIEDEFYLL